MDDRELAVQPDINITMQNQASSRIRQKPMLAKNTSHLFGMSYACKKWVAGGKNHPEWKGPQASNINVHSGNDVKQLLTQQMEKVMKQVATKLSESPK